MNHIRIEKIADMVEKGVTLADIGTDHALLPVILVQKGKCNKVYACDIAEGPLASARETIDKNKLSDFIHPVLSDGLCNVPDDADAIVIAGMGFLTAKEILEQDIARLSSFRQIITEVNRDWHLMRQWISEHNYTIRDEVFVHEKNHDYVIISFTSSFHPSYTKEEIELGPILMHQKDPQYLQYCEKQYAKFQMILSKSDRVSPVVQERYSIYRAYLNK